MNRSSTRAGMVLGLLALTAVATPSFAAVNLLANPGFETGGGSYTGWFTFGSGVQLSLPLPGDNIIHGGVAASKVYGEFTGCPGAPQFSVGGFGQAFTPTAGRVYELSGFSFVSAADPIPGTSICNNNRLIAKIVFFNAVSGGAELASSEVVIGDYQSLTNRWNGFSVSAPAPTGALRVEALFLFLQPACDGGAVFVDDVSFTEVTPPSVPNLLVNPSFTSSLSGWSTFGNVYYDARNFLVRSPAGSAKLFSTFVIDSPSGLFQSFTATSGTAWRMDLHALNTCREDPITGTNDNYAMARIVFRNAANAEIGGSETVVVDNTSPLGKWTDHALIGTAPVGTVKAEAYVLVSSPTLQGGAVWVDDRTFRTVDVSAVSETPRPAAFDLGQNVPNPFNPFTRIDFELRRGSTVDISVFDVAGRRVASLFEGRLDAGAHSVTWDGTTMAGERAAGGIYRCVMTTPDGRMSRNMVLVH
jgi:hypothetical protein